MCWESNPGLQLGRLLCYRCITHPGVSGGGRTRNLWIRSPTRCPLRHRDMRLVPAGSGFTRYRSADLGIFSATLSHLSYKALRLMPTWQ
ncbi:hypothetical protein MT325_m343L [Paramecium bursaria chlorella virus MT325]|uniref:Uncharacterized protein m343L n=1 Tax=Paramecium bursaria Chlorella virus MT325 TaxID=346932 RepID=A7IU73_PBCVM|nr:hypothetical protein MT325_m343L [Paramecium bursaria chlorella virus MT325]